MNERDYKLLLALNKTKNITHAAELLFTTQSSVSKRIKVLEDQLNVALLVRSQKGITFTPQGEVVLQYALDTISNFKKMKDSIKDDNNYNNINGSLTAGFSMNYTIYNLPKVLEVFREKYNQINFNIITEHSRNLYNKLIENELDMAIIRGDYQWDYKKILLSQENVYLIKSQNDQYKDLSDIPYIRRRSDSNFEQNINKWLYENQLENLINNIYIDNISTCVEMVNCGLGWAIVPEICLKNFNGLKMQLKFNNGENFVRSTHILCSKDASNLPQVNALVGIIKNLNNKG